MADYEEQVSSTTSLGDELITQVGPHHGMGDSNEAVSNDRFNVNEIVDLVGGAQDAIERHIAEGSATIDDTELFSKQPEPEYEPVTVSEPEQVALPVLGEPEAEPSAAPQTTVTEDATELTKEEAAPEPATLVEPSEEPVVAPTAKPESTEIVAPQSVIQEPIPSPIAVAPVAPPTATASLTREEDSAVAPVSHAPSLPKPPAAALMHFPTELGQKGDSPAPISPLSPLHSPDSLEELSLTESPNQPPACWASSATPLGSSSTAASQEASPRRMPWEAQESDAEPGRGKNPEGLLDPIAAPYLSLGKDPERLPYLCGDSGVSVSPEEKLLSSNKSSSGPSPINPQMKVPESHHAPSNPTDSWDTQFMASEDNSQSLIDSFSKDTAAISLSSYEAHIQASQSDDLMYEVKKNNNPFDGFSPLADAGYSHFSEAQSDSHVGKMSESPTPDLVQYRQSGDSQDSLPSFFEDKMDPHAAEQRMSQYSSGLREDDDEDEEDSPLPPSLPDILKSSPLNPDKLDSGSSEGSAEQSPVLERRMMESPNPPINLSANNPFAFDSKVSLLKEMAEETEARSNGKPQPEDDPCFGAFNLVKEAEETSPTKAKEQEPFKMEQKDWFSSHDSPKMVDNFEPLHFEGKKTADDSDSESPTADSLSPVLEAMAKNPASFQVGLEKKDQKLDVEAEVEMAEEVSEHEVSSEEFEFIERPPRGMIDEFLEALDNSKFAASRVPEIPMDEELSFEKKTSPSAAPAKAAIPTEAPDQSYLLLTQKSKAELEKPEIPQSPVQPQVDQSPASELPVVQSPASKPTEALAEKTGGARMFHMPILKMDTVGDLLYWRDVKTTGVVFGAALLLLLSLTVCSIVSVASYVALALLSVTVSFRIYKGILQAIQKSDEGHPFKLYLDQEVALSDDVTHKYSDMVLAKVNKSIVELRRLFLVEDLVDSIKFAVLMWILTYVGALFNGLTLLILVLVGVFSCPIIYEKHQVQIDHYVGMVNNQIKDIVGKIQAKVPGAKRKAE